MNVTRYTIYEIKRTHEHDAPFVIVNMLMYFFFTFLAGLHYKNILPHTIDYACAQNDNIVYFFNATTIGNSISGGILKNHKTRNSSSSFI